MGQDFNRDLESNSIPMLKAWYISLLTAACMAAVGFATNLATARGLGPEGRGLIASATLVVTLSAGVAQLGLGSAFVFLYRSDIAWAAARFLKKTLVLIIFVAMSLGVIAVHVFHHFPPEIELPIILACAVYGAHGLTVTIVQVEKNLLLYNFSRLAFPALVLIAVIFCWVSGDLSVKNVIALQVIVGLVIVTISNLAMKTAGVYRHPTENESSDKSSFSSYFMLGMKYHLTVVVGLILNNIDKVYFVFEGGTKEFGLYSVAYSTSRLVGTLQDTISTALFSTFAGEGHDGIRKAIAISFRMTFFPLLLGVALVSPFSEILIRLAFGEKFENAALPFTILMFDSVVGGAGWMLAQRFNAVGRPGMILMRQVTAVIPLLFFFPFIPKENLSVWLACLLLGSSTIRLVMTFVMYRVVLQEPLKELLPRKSDLLRAGALITRGVRT